LQLTEYRNDKNIKNYENLEKKFALLK